MKYRIEAQSKRRIRVRLRSFGLTEEEARILDYAFSGMPGVTKVTVYRATGNCALEFDCGIDEIEERMLGPVGVPEGEIGVFGGTVAFVDFMVPALIAAVNVGYEVGHEEAVVKGGVESPHLVDVVVLHLNP